jgi:hypothetical protein
MKPEYVASVIISAIAIILVIYFVNQETNKVPYRWSVDATKDSTDIAGTYYRVRITNIGLNPVTHISVNLGSNDTQHLTRLDPGQEYFFYPSTQTNALGVKIFAENGINFTSDYRSPLKGIGLPGSGR